MAPGTVPPARSFRPGLLSALLVGVVVAVVALPALAVRLVPTRVETVPAGTVVALDRPSPTALVTPPTGWEVDQIGSGPYEPTIYRSGDSTLELYPAPGAVPEAFAPRQLRRAAARGLDVRPAGVARTTGGFAGPRFRVSDGDGRHGEIAVVGRGGDSVGVWLLADPGVPADAGAVLASLRPAA